METPRFGESLAEFRETAEFGSKFFSNNPLLKVSELEMEDFLPASEQIEDD